jgi:ribosomal protein S25
MLKNVPKILMITRSILCEKYKVSGSIARALIRDLHSKSLIEPVGQQHAKFDLFRGVQSKSALEKAADEAAELEKKNKGKK